MNKDKEIASVDSQEEKALSVSHHFPVEGAPFVSSTDHQR